jgi:hypothetical protein
MHRDGGASARGLCERLAANFPDRRVFAMFKRNNPVHAPILFALLLINLAWSGFFSLYWLKDNNWALGPDELGIQWLSDEDFKAIENSTSPEYKLAGGSTLVLPGDPDERHRMLSFYQVRTPDGRWHGRASSRGHAPTMQTWMGVAWPVFIVSVIGLVFFRPGAEKPSAKEREREAFATI